MKRIVADTGPLNCLIQVDAIGYLPELFQNVVLPGGVLQELQSPGAPAVVQDWAGNLPPWVEVMEVEIENIPGFRGLSNTDLQVLAAGVELNAPVLLDDLAARTAGKSLGVPVLGTLGVLELAAAKGLVSLPEILARLKQTNIHLSERLFREALLRDAGRKG